MNQTRVARTSDLIELCEAADHNRFNRRMDTEEVRRLADPDGLHVLGMLLYDHHPVMSMSVPHHRCEVLVKVRDTMEPLVGHLDVPAAMWNALPTAEAVQAAQERAMQQDAS